MSKTLIVSDNEILNQLYVVNLEVYLGTEVELVLSFQKAQELIDSGLEYNLIVTMNMINGQDSAIMLYEYLQSKKWNKPLVVIGKPEKEVPNIVIIQSSYHLQNLLKSCAEILGVTAKSMAGHIVPEYYAVETSFLLRLGVAPCQIFLQVKKNSEVIDYLLVAKKDDKTTESLRKFSSEGIVKLFVNKLDRLLVINQISKSVCDFIQSTENLGVAEKSNALSVGFDFIASDFCQTPESTHEVMAIAKVCTSVMEDIAKDTAGLRALIKILSSNPSGYIYTHSILASFVAAHIVRKVSWGGEGHLEKINFVLFFHDIMLGPIYLKYPELKYEDDLLFSEKLDEEEKSLVLNHARLAAELVINYRRAPLGVDLLIKQHHGITNGIGFATEFKDDISPLSKIVLVAEAFVEEYMKGRDLDPKFQIDLKVMLPILVEKFKKSTYKKIIETLETIKL